ncbi:MAG: hypothetical protein HYY34_00175 [Chloroflexi bacterium]|nr:hypothetical protein [Chloroflexota bacterium]
MSEVDAYGNEVAGIRLPEVSVPLASTPGWTLRHPDVGGETQLLMFAGATLPFAPTRSARLENGDPRLSIRERYPSKEAYLDLVREAGRKLAADRNLLEEDIEFCAQRASMYWDRFA